MWLDEDMVVEPPGLVRLEQPHAPVVHRLQREVQRATQQREQQREQSQHSRAARRGMRRRVRRRGTG